MAGSRPFQEQFRAAVADQVGSSVHVALLSETVATGDLEALAADMGLEVFAGGQLSESMGRRQAAPGVLYAAIGLDLTESWCSVDRLRGTRTPVPIQIHRPLSKLRVSSPIEWHPTLLLGGHVGFGVLAPFLSVPHSPSVARLFHRNASWMSDGLRWFTNPVPHYEFDLGAPTGSEVLSAALTDRGVRFELNDKGCQVEGILDATNTDEGLIVHPLFAPIVQALTGKPSRDLAHLLEQYAANGMPSDLAEDLRVVAAFSRLPECSLDDIRSRAESGAGKAEVSAVLDWMARCRLLHRGFRVECAVCGLKDFVLSRAAGPNPTCSGCGSQAGFTASAAGEPEHRYRLSTLLHRVSLNGGLVPLRATAQLRADRYFVVPGANLFNGDEQIGECDLLGWRDRVIFTGEAKTSADYFTLDQAQRDAQLAEAVGASEHVLACARQIDAEVIGLYEGVMTPLEVFVAVV